MQRISAARTAAAAAVLFAIAFFLTVASVNVPHTSSDAKLLAWWQDAANIRSGLFSLLFAVCTAVFFAVVVNYLLTLAPRTSQVQWTAFARSMSAAFTATLLVSAALRGVIGHLVEVQDEPLPRVDVLRYSTALNYTLIGTIVMAMFALTVIAIAVIVLRTGLLGRWVGYVGLGCGTLVIVATFAMVGQFTIPVAILWAFSTAVAIWRQPATTTTPAEAVGETVAV
jgi:hypothetical protein